MGMLDSLWVPCPNCGKPMEFQSKAWNCDMDRYTVDDAPGPVLFDVMNAPNYCKLCGQWVALIDPVYPPGEQAKPKLKAVKVKTPENPEVHESGCWRWWPDDRNFTYADLEEPIQ